MTKRQLTDNERMIGQAMGDRMEEVRVMFKPEIRERLKITFLVRDPDNTEMELMMSDDDPDGVRSALDRMEGRESEVVTSDD